MIFRPATLVLALCLLGCMPMLAAKPAASFGETSVLHLSSLNPSCKLEKRWVGTVPVLTWGIWLQCNGVDMLVVHPWNLISKVRIDSADEALEFVRFFSSEETFASVQLGGLLEVGKVNEWCPSLRAALDQTGSLLPKVEAHEGRGDARYYVTRVVVAYDQKVYEITETLRKDGFYSELRRVTILEDVRKLGCLHDAP